MKEAEFSHGWLKEQCDRIEAKATLVPRLEQRIADLEAQVAELTKDIGWIERAARKGYLPRWSRHDQMWFINDEDAYQTLRAAIDAARKAGA